MKKRQLKYEEKLGLMTLFEYPEPAIPEACSPFFIKPRTKFTMNSYFIFLK